MHFNISHVSAVAAALSSVVSTWYSGPGLPLNGSLSAGFGKRSDVAPGVELRIMPLGGSITFGSHSSDGNGYRGPLAKLLAGTKLKFIGSVRSGDMADNYNEGHPGYTIRDTANTATNSLGYRPNVILLHVGTNDFDFARPKETTEAAPERLGGLIDELVFVCPDATILVAQLVHAADPVYDRRIQLFNNEVPKVVAKRAKAGHRVMVSDMRSIAKKDLVDGIHPTDAGYKKMAAIWFADIKAAHAKGWIHPPIGPDPPAFGKNSKGQPVLVKKRRCLQEPSLKVVNGGQPITGSLGFNEHAQFFPNWLKRVQASKGRQGHKAADIHFADLNGDGRADYLWVNPKNGAIVAYLNTGHGIAQSWTVVNNGKHIAAGPGGTGDRVFFADLNGDGRADYIYMHKDGKFTWWRNDGPSTLAKVGWKWHGPTDFHLGANHATLKNVLFGDINGDGRDDFLIKDAHGGLESWLNIGNSYHPDTITWVSSGKITDGLNTANIALADINGDGRDDYLTWDKEGGLSGYINVRGSREGHPVWVKQGRKAISEGIHVTSQWLRLADFTGDGKADVARIHEKGGAIDLYVNHGKAATTVAGDGIRFADLNGDGTDDHIFISVLGRINFYLNSGAQAKAKHGWRWVNENNGGVIASGAGATRREIHFADIDGDGKADFLRVHDNGAVDCWINGGANKRAHDKWLWFPQGQIGSGFGSGDGVQFADIDGDGRADLIWLSKSGAMTVWLNKATQIKGNNIKIKPKWVKEPPGQPIHNGAGAFRKDVRFADIDGDGKADYIWAHPEDGSISVWINQPGKTRRLWAHYSQKISKGVGSAGANVLFAYIDRNERADYVVVNPNSGSVRVWTSSCSKLAPLPASPAGPAAIPNLPKIHLPSLPPMPPLTLFGTVPGVGNPGTSPGDQPSSENSITGVDIPGVLTLGIPKVNSPGTIPKCGPQTVSGGVPLASQVTKDFIDSQRVLRGLGESATCKELSSAKEVLSKTFTALAILAVEAKAVDITCLKGSDLNLMQHLRTELPTLLKELRLAIIQLFGRCGSPNASPDDSTLHFVQSLFGSTGVIGQLIIPVLGPLTSYSGGSAGTPAEVQPPSETSIVGVTVPGILTLGIPTIIPGTLPTCGPSTIGNLVPLTVQVKQLFHDFQQVVVNLNSASTTCKVLLSAKDDFSKPFTALALLAAKAKQTDISCLKESDLRLVQVLDTKLPNLLGELRLGLTQLFGQCSSPNASPDESVLQSVQSQLESIDQQVGSALEPFTSQSQGDDHGGTNNGGSNNGGSNNGGSNNGGSNNGGSNNGGSSNGGSNNGGSSNGGSDSSGGGCKKTPGIHVGGLNVGGVPLCAVNLPRLGSAAINALRPFASQTLDALTNAGRGITGLAGGGIGGSSLASGDVSQVGTLFSGLFEDATDLAAAGENIELTSFGEGEVTDIINMQDGLNNLRDLLKGDLSDITRFITNPPSGLQDFRRIAAQFGVGGTILGLSGVSLNYIIHYSDHNSNGNNNDDNQNHRNGGQQATPTGETPTTTTTASHTEWLLNTVPGTSREEFEAFVSKLPDHGGGERIIYPALGYQNYVAKMTVEQAKLVSKYPIVDQMGPNDPVEHLGDDISQDEESNHAKRSTRQKHDGRAVTYGPQPKRRQDQTLYPTFQEGSPLHLKMISYPKNRRISQLVAADPDPPLQYGFDRSGGAGSFIYVLDNGFDFMHNEFRLAYRQRREYYISSGLKYRNGDPVTSMREEGPQSGWHGTGVASMAVGLSVGVAKNAQLIAVKFTANGSRLTVPAHLADAWSWAVADVRAKNRMGKAVINLSYNHIYSNFLDANQHVDYHRWNLRTPARSDYFLPLLRDAWDANIATVVTTGNFQRLHLGDFTPQRFGREDNPLITVGTMNQFGIPSSINSNEGPSTGFTSLTGPPTNPVGADPELTGSLTVYAHGQLVKTAVAYTTYGYKNMTGTSLAAGQVAGLAAYFAGVPGGGPFTSMGIKEKIVDSARRGPVSPDAHKLIYNGLREIYCASNARVWRREANESDHEKVKEVAARQMKRQDDFDPNPVFRPQPGNAFACRPATDEPPGFWVSKFESKHFTYLAISSAHLGGCQTRNFGQDLSTHGAGKVDGWLGALSEGASYSLKGVFRQDVVAISICDNTSISPIKFSPQNSATYSFIDHAGTKGSCAIKPDGSALDILSCQEGDEEVTQKVYLDCAVPDNPKYCNDFK